MARPRWGVSLVGGGGPPPAVAERRRAWKGAPPAGRLAQRRLHRCRSGRSSRRWQRYTYRRQGPTHSEVLRHRVRRKWASWRAMGAAVEVLRWLRHGVRLDFQAAPPPPFHHGESCSDVTGPKLDFLKAELERWEESGAIRPATTERYISKVFMVPKPRVNKWRICWDGRHVNSFCRPMTVGRFARQDSSSWWMGPRHLQVLGICSFAAAPPPLDLTSARLREF
jgi:hypothetical protein